MSEKFNISNLSKKELAIQLRKPVGNDGKEVGKQMNKGNKYICLNSYKILNPQKNSLVLEIGMGNGLFIKDLLNNASNIKYIGLDFSQVMIDEATELNQNLIDEQKVSFINGSVNSLPFKDNSIDYITTTNTVYFWPSLKENAKEIYRVLKPNGKVLIGYRSKDLMDKIELANYGFNKYTKDEIEALLKDTGFRKIATEIIAEPNLDFDGKPIEMEGFYSIGIK
jgi:ubiquinone/menaquinone biosynthesis C-methylase UbiE